MTELEKLPTGWLVTNLKQVVLKIQYGYTASAKEEAVGPKLLRITDLQNNSVDWASVPFCECSDVGKYALKTGDIVIARTGATTGKSFLLEEVVEDTIFASYLIRLSTSEQFPPNYLAWFMRSLDYWQQIIVVSKGSAQPGANANILSELKIPLPPLNEQRRIVAKIEGLTARSRKAREALNAIPPLLDQFRQSVLAAAFRGDLTADWRAANPDVEPAEKLLERIRVERRERWEKAELEKMKAKGKDPNNRKWKNEYPEPESIDSERLPSLPDGWHWAKWEQIGLCQNGRAFPSKNYSSSGTKLLRPGNLNVSGRIEWTEKNTRHMPNEWADEFPDYIIGPDSLVINLTAQSLADEFLGRVCLTQESERCLLNQRIARIVPLLVSTKFCLWLFKSAFFRRYVDDLNTGSLIQHIFVSQINEFVFPLPPLVEQEEIIRLVESHTLRSEELNLLVQDMHGNTPLLDQSILAKAFRGELVPQDPNDEPASFLLDRIRREREKAQKPEKAGKGKKKS